MSARPKPFDVALVPHDPRWAARAADDARVLATTLGPALLRVHHIGSTSITGLRAKPVIDLVPVVAGLTELDARRSSVEALGYEWWGELGLPGRRYCARSDQASGVRLTQLHCYAAGSPEIARHLIFRDELRANPDLAAAYDAEKQRCMALHPQDSHAYGDCKSAWIRHVEAKALARLGGDWSEPPPLAL